MSEQREKATDQQVEQVGERNREMNKKGQEPTPTGYGGMDDQRRDDSKPERN